LVHFACCGGVSGAGALLSAVVVSLVVLMLAAVLRF
jgi:hypothetical protein